MFNKNSLTKEDILINNFFYGYYYGDQHPLDPRACETSRKKCKLIISRKNNARSTYNVSLIFFNCWDYYVQLLIGSKMIF